MVETASRMKLRFLRSVVLQGCLGHGSGSIFLLSDVQLAMAQVVQNEQTVLLGWRRGHC